MIYKKINESKHLHDASGGIRLKARFLRKNLTSAEKILWSYLRNRQVKNRYFRRQHPYSHYILDFYCFSANLAIEVDGPIHQYKKEYDWERTEFIESTGLKVLRFTNHEVENETQKVLDKIRSYL